MSAIKEQEQLSTSEQSSTSILEQAVMATKQTSRDQTEQLLKTLTQNALDGTIKWDKNVIATINQAIKAIDNKLSKQLTAIIQHEKVNKIEGTWRGLHHFVMNTETSAQLKIKFLNFNKKELFKDIDKAVEFDQSQLFKKIYENEFGMPGGEPYGLLVGDYYFSNHPQDIDLLQGVSNIAAASFCPFISATDAKMFGFNDWTELSKPRDLEKIFDSVEYAKWNSFRQSEDSRFVNLVAPRALARLPYGEDTNPIAAFDFEEAPKSADGKPQSLNHQQYCWMNAAYLLATNISAAFAENGWCTAIRGAENGGKVKNLPLHIFNSDDGDIDSKCPTEIGITDRREAELSKLGFLPLSHYKNTDYAVFFGAQSTQLPKKYDKPEATANAQISARLPYIMATSRFAHYLKIMARDKIGSFMEVTEAEEWLNKWILQYVNANDNTGAKMKAKYPLAEAKISVSEIPGQPGSYNAVAWLRPWLQMEELTTSLRLVAKIPQQGA